MCKEYFYNVIVKDKKGFPAFILRQIAGLLSLFYLLAVKLRLVFYGIALFKSVRLGVPVISVGNLTWGGSGKTPLVEAICLYFKSCGRTPAVLTRGYGSDEDKALRENLADTPVLIGKDRIKAAVVAQRLGTVDIFVLDDGFQHLKVSRDLDIVAINATNPFGNGRLIPAGILREPVSHLRRADLAVITRTELMAKEELNRIKGYVLKINPGIEIFDSVHQPVSLHTNRDKRLELEYLRGRGICALAALGDNASFVQALINLGADVKLKFLYMDHYRYTQRQADEVLNECEVKNITTIVTTMKDWVKLRGFLAKTEDIEVLTLNIKLKIKDEKEFFRRLSSILSC